MRGRTTLILSGLGLVVGVGLETACHSTWLNPNHCANNDGNAFCGERHPDGSLPFCVKGACSDAPDGCVEEELADEACNSPCGDADPNCETAEGSSSVGTSGPTGTTSMTTTEATSVDASETMTDSGGACDGDEDCSAPTPFCNAQRCVDCLGVPDPDATCAAADPAMPVCEGGACVQCVEGKTDACMGTTPECDLATSTCVGCWLHVQCPGSACDFVGGGCIEGVPIEVDGDSGCSNMAECGTGANPPCCTVQMAIGQIGNGEAGVIRLHELDGGMPYFQSPIVTGAKTVAIMAAPAELPVIQGTGNPGLRVETDASVYVQRVRFDGAPAAGVAIDAATAVYLDACEIVDNDGGGVTQTAGAPEIVIRNSIVGGDVNNVAALSVTSGTLDVLYSTLFAGFGTSAALSCTDDAVIVRNSILVSSGTDPEIACPIAEVTYSATEDAFAGDGNVTVGDVDNAWFVAVASGNFLLSATGFPIFEGIAQWRTGDPPTDIQGDVRPDVDLTMDYAGADLLP